MFFEKTKNNIFGQQYENRKFQNWILFGDYFFEFFDPTKKYGYFPYI